MQPVLGCFFSVVKFVISIIYVVFYLILIYLYGLKVYHWAIFDPIGHTFEEYPVTVMGWVEAWPLSVAIGGFEVIRIFLSLF